MIKASMQQFNYFALSYSQRNKESAPAFVVFNASAADIVQWADVDRLDGDNLTGAQRPLRELKVSKVAKFLSRDDRNTIPTSVIIALDSGAITFNGTPPNYRENTEWHGKITISMRGSDKPGLIIDGQHRVFGAAKFDATTRLNIVAFLGGDDAERAFQFVVINNSATRVPKDHIKALNLNYDKDKLNTRLINSAGVALGINDVKYDDLQTVDGTAPFKGLLEWPTNPGGYIQPSAIEGALAETRDRAALLGIEELERDVFLAIWIKIRALRKSIWAPFPESRLLQKVSIHALTVYVLESMIAKQRMDDTPTDFTNEVTLDNLVERVVTRIPEKFWITEWKATQLDTSSGRQLLLDALQVIDSNVRFSRPWYDKVSLVDPALISGQTYEKSKTVAKKVSAKNAATKKTVVKKTRGGT